MKVLISNNNADLEKIRKREELINSLTSKQLKKSTAHCSEQDDVDGVVDRLNTEGIATLDAPPYDANLVRYGVQQMWLGLLLLVLGLVGLGFVRTDSASMFDVIIKFFIALLMSLGLALILMGYQYRTAQNLPKKLHPADVTAAHELIHALRDDVRRTVGRWNDVIGTFLTTSDAAILLYLLVPIILPNLSPVTQLLAVCAGSLFVARIIKALIDNTAYGIRLGHVVRYHDVLMKSEQSAECATAARINQVYGPILGGSWPVSPSWWQCYLRSLWPALGLVALLGMLFGLRLFIANDGADMLAMCVIAVMLLASVALAIHLAVAAEGLTPTVENARRIANRYQSAADFHAEMVLDTRRVVAVFHEGRQHLRDALAPKRHGKTTSHRIDQLGQPLRARLVLLEAAEPGKFAAPPARPVVAASPPAGAAPAVVAPKTSGGFTAAPASSRL